MNEIIPEHLQCGRIVEFEPQIKKCQNPIMWHFSWSDREGYVCNVANCLTEILKAHDGDHSYDQTGINWESISGSESQYTPAKKYRKTPPFWEAK